MIIKYIYKELSPHCNNNINLSKTKIIAYFKLIYENIVGLLIQR